MINAAWAWLASLDWQAIILVAGIVVAVGCCVGGAWLTLVRNAQRAGE